MLARWFAYVEQLKQHTLYLRLLVLLLCISMSIVLIMGGALFLVDYVPVSQAALKKVNEKRLFLKAALEEYKYKSTFEDTIIVNNPGPYLLDVKEQDLDWLFHQKSPDLVRAIRQLEDAQHDYSHLAMQGSPASRLDLIMRVDRAYDDLAKALAYDLKIKQSVISLLQLVALMLIVGCVTAIAISGRRILVDRVDHLLSFMPDSLIEVTPSERGDEFSLLEQKLFGVMTQLEGLLVGRTWADQTSERLRRMMRSQEFLLRFVDTITNEAMSEITLRKLLHTLEKAFNANNVAVIFDDGNTRISQHKVVYSHHIPLSLPVELMSELAASGQLGFLEFSHDRQEVRCFALLFSSMPDAQDVLLIETERDHMLEDHEVQLLELTTRLLTMVIGYQGREQEERRIVLLEERAAIARELHDSLAQSLSFMKIQIARLQAGNSGSEQALMELRTGLDNAYRELRELLATFRVHMDVRGLGFAIQSAIEEFSQRSSLSIVLDNRLVNCRLTVNEEFHILHIVREALSNIVRHSGASHVSVEMVYQPGGHMVVTIDDNGIGYKPGNDGQDHYGQTIMKERAYSLGGDIEVTARRNGGTRVRLVFTPKLPQA
ncbi:MAG: histidine kinase [Methylobacillus sp.]|jgi:two-component system nitrate/nitrite sensor histidine kinase NarX|nr:histidine kinase [Methylobacillus sp.]